MIAYEPITPFEEVKVPVSNSTEFFQKKCPLEDFDGGWLGLKSCRIASDVCLLIVSYFKSCGVPMFLSFFLSFFLLVAVSMVGDVG